MLKEFKNVMEPKKLSYIWNNKYDLTGGTSVQEAYHQNLNKMKALINTHSFEKGTIVANLVYINRAFAISNKYTILPRENKDNQKMRISLQAAFKTKDILERLPETEINQKHLGLSLFFGLKKLVLFFV